MNQLYTVDDEGKEARLAAPNRSNEIDGTWSPTNDRIAFISDRDGGSDLYFIELSTQAVHRLTRTGGVKLGPAWSPGGDRIAFCERTGDGFEIFLVNVDDSHLVQLTGASGERLRH